MPTEVASNVAGLISREEAAEYLGVTPRWISRAVEERRFPFIKLGKTKQGRLRFRKTDLDEYIDAHTVNPSER